MHITLLLFKVAFFGYRIWRLLNWYAVTSDLVTGCVGLRISLNRYHQISGYKANKALDTIPTCRIAISVKLLFPFDVICVEYIVLIRIAIIYFGVRNTYQFHYLQACSCLRTWTTGASARGILLFAGIDRQLDSQTPYINWDSFGRRVGIQRFVYLGIIDQVSGGV